MQVAARQQVRENLQQMLAQEMTKYITKIIYKRLGQRVWASSPLWLDIKEMKCNTLKSKLF